MFCSCANEVITDLSSSIDNYMKNHCLKREKFIILAKVLLELIQEYDSDSSLSDFDMESTNKGIEQKRRQNGHIESTLLSFSEISNKLQEIRVLKERQNKKYESSLDTDQRKAEEREASQEKIKYLVNLKVYRLSKLKTEPYITEDSVLVSVLRTTLGKSSDFFIQMKGAAKFVTGQVVYQQNQNSFI